MNFATQPEEKLENLPSRTVSRVPKDSWSRYRGANNPRRKINRWIEAQVGKHIDVITSKFTALEWVPAQYRAAHTLREYIEMDTFTGKDGRVYYYSSYLRGYVGQSASANFAAVEDSSRRLLYLCPETRVVKLFIPKTRESYKTINQRKLDAKVRFLGDYHQLSKKDGIWYEVRAEKINRFNNGGPFFNGGERLQRPNDVLLDYVFRRADDSQSSYVKIVLKRQLNWKELRDNGLKND